jgi:hypothetical protein
VLATAKIEKETIKIEKERWQRGRTNEEKRRGKHLN